MSLSMHMSYLPKWTTHFKTSLLGHTIRHFCLFPVNIFPDEVSCLYCSCTKVWKTCCLLFFLGFPNTTGTIHSRDEGGINYVSIKYRERLWAHVAWSKGLSEAKPEGKKTVKLVSVDQRYGHKAICPFSEYNWQQRRATPHSGNHTHSGAANVNSSWIDRVRRVGEEHNWHLCAVSTSITSQVSLLTSTQSCSSRAGTSKRQEQIGVLMFSSNNSAIVSSLTIGKLLFMSYIYFMDNLCLTCTHYMTFYSLMLSWLYVFQTCCLYLSNTLCVFCLYIHHTTFYSLTLSCFSYNIIM